MPTLRERQIMTLTVSPQGRVCGDLRLSGRASLSPHLESLPARPAEENTAGDKPPREHPAAHPEKPILRGFESAARGDISIGAFWLAWAAPQEGSRMILRNIGLDPGRLGFVDALLRMGAGIREEVLFCGEGEWFGNLDIRGGALRPIEIEPDKIPALVDEIPILAVLAAKAHGVSRIRGIPGLPNSKADRISATVTNLKRMSAEIEEFSDGIIIHGSGRLQGARLDSFGDPRIAMASLIAGLLADDGDSVIQNAGCIDDFYPEFRPVLLSLLETSVKNRVTAPSSHEIHSGDAGIAQWQSNGFVNQKGRFSLFCMALHIDANHSPSTGQNFHGLAWCCVVFREF